MEKSRLDKGVVDDWFIRLGGDVAGGKFAEGGVTTTGGEYAGPG